MGAYGKIQLREQIELWLVVDPQLTAQNLPTQTFIVTSLKH